MKVVLIFLIFFSFAFSKSSVELRRMYVDELLNYSLELPDVIYNPFKIETNKTKKIDKNVSLNEQFKALKVKKEKKIEKKFELLSILSNKVLVKFDNNIQWAGVGDKIGHYKILKILSDGSGIVVLHNKKTETIKLENVDINIHIKVIK